MSKKNKGEARVSHPPLESFGAVRTVADHVGVVGIVTSVYGLAHVAPEALAKLASRTATGLEGTLAPDALRRGIPVGEITLRVTRQEAGVLVNSLSKWKQVATIAGQVGRLSGWVTVAATAVSAGIYGYCYVKSGD